MRYLAVLSVMAGLLAGCAGPGAYIPDASLRSAPADHAVAATPATQVANQTLGKIAVARVTGRKTIRIASR